MYSMSGTGDHVLPISKYGASPRVGVMAIPNSFSRQLREERENSIVSLQDTRHATLFLVDMDAYCTWARGTGG